MAQTTDWFIASRSEALDLLNSEDPFEDYPSLSLKGILTLELLQLGKIILGTEEMPEPIAQGPEEGLMVLEVSPKLLAALAGIPPQQVKRVAIEWASSAEHVRELPVADIEQALADLSEFATRALAERKSVLELVEA